MSRRAAVAAVPLAACGVGVAVGSVPAPLPARLAALAGFAALAAWTSLRFVAKEDRVVEPPPLPPVDPSLLLESVVVSREAGPPIPSLTRSALLQAPPTRETPPSLPLPPDPGDMIGRLEPESFRWIDSTPAERRFLGYTLEELRSTSFLDVVFREDRELAREQLRGALVKGEAHGLVYRLRTARGEGKAVEVNVGVRYKPDGAVDHLRCHVTDVTEQLRADRQLRRRTRSLLAANGELLMTNRQLQELKDRYTDLYQNAPAMYFSLDESGAFRECNNTLLAALGYAREDLIGRPYVTIVPAWRRPAFAAHFARFLSCGEVDVESQWLKADGEAIDVHITGTAVFGPDGGIVRSRSVAVDITARKALESALQEKNARLARAVEDLARKNKELDDFTYGVSHDLQEPLRTLVFFSGMLLEDYGDRLSGEGREHLEFVLSASKRMRQLVADLLALSRAGKTAGPFGPIDLEALLEQVRADLSAAILNSCAGVTIASPLPPAWGDRDRVARLLSNLIANALKYTRPGERPRVRVWAEAGEAGAVTIAVKDEGIGIDPAHHDKVFGLFRRLHTADEYEGTGAGLTICKAIAEAHGGRIAVESAIGHGATFRVYLPGPSSCGASASEAHRSE